MDLRPLVASLLVAVLLAVLVLAGTVSAVPNAQLTVAEVTVDPDQPTAGEPFTIAPSVESSVGSDEPVTIDSVTATVDGEQIQEVTNEGTLSPGDSVTVPVTTSFAAAGEYTIEFEIVGTDASGERVELTREETVVVSPVPDVRLTVDDVQIEPETPTAGEPVTLPITVTSSGGSTQPIDVERVALLDGDEQLVSAENPGALAIGDSITVPLTTTFEEGGVRTLTAELRGTNANNESVVVRQPVTVVVEVGAPAIELGNSSGVDGALSELSMTVSNPTEATLRNVVTTVSGDDLTGEIDRRVIPALDPGETTDLSFVVRPDGAGEALFETEISYTTAAGTEANLSRTDTLAVEPLEEAVTVRVQRTTGEQESDEPDLGVDVESILDGGGNGQESTSTDSGVRVTVSNLGNTPVTNVVVDPQADDRSLGPRPVATELQPGAEESVVVSLERTPPTEVVFEATYDVVTERSSATATFDPTGTQGSVTVTSVDLETGGDSLQITGDVGNPGGSEISGVVVSVDSTEGVSPVYPSRDFFVGEIDGDGFAPFELTASVDENATHIPLTVQYFADGDERVETVELPVETPPEDSAGDGPPWVVTAGVVAMLGMLLAVIILFVRRE